MKTTKKIIKLSTFILSLLFFFCSSVLNGLAQTIDSAYDYGNYTRSDPGSTSMDLYQSYLTDNSSSSDNVYGYSSEAIGASSEMMDYQNFGGDNHTSTSTYRWYDAGR